MTEYVRAPDAELAETEIEDRSLIVRLEMALAEEAQPWRRMAVIQHFIYLVRAEQALQTLRQHAPEKIAPLLD